VGVKEVRLIRRAFASVHDDPDAAIELATGIIDAPSSTPSERAEARWARGMARRERGVSGLGADDLFTARQEACDAGDQVLAARIDTTLALVALYTGSTDGALEILAQAEPHLRGADLARLENQRGLVRHRAGDAVGAVRDYHRALRRFEHDPDPVGQVLVLMNLGLLHAQHGHLAPAERTLVTAAEVGDRNGLRYLAAASRHNLGYARARAGRLAEAMDDMSAARLLLSELDRPEVLALVEVDLAELLLQSNLLEEAVSTVDRALDGVRRHGNETDLADTALLAARCRLAAGRLVAARTAATESVASLHRQGRGAWAVLGEFVGAQIESEEGADGEIAGRFEEIAVRLERHGWSGESMAARVRAAQLLSTTGELDRAKQVVGKLRDSADRPAGERAAIHLVRGLVAEAEGDRPLARRAIQRGLRVVTDNQATVGAFEFRTFAAGHGAPLVEAGVRLAVGDRRPRAALDHLEATRRMLWLVPRAQPPDDDALAELLARLRLADEDRRRAVGAGDHADRLRRHCVELEREIAVHTRRAGRSGDAGRMSVADAIGELDDHALVEYALVGSELHAVSVVGGRAWLHDLGSIDGLAGDIDACTFALHRLNRVQGSAASRAAAATTIDTLGGRLAQRLVPERIRRSARPIVVVPDGPLHGLAWGAMAELSGRAVSVSPSLIGWAVARRRRITGSASRRVLIGAGPDLPGAAVEVSAVAALYRRPTLLTGADASADRVLHELGRSRLAHLACHGSFRTDNPLFSTLSMADGPLTVYDLERCPSLPGTIVLSACNVATSSVLRGGTLLGLSSALMTFGASSVIAPLTPVSDEHVVGVMAALHRALVAGRSPAEALAATAIDADSGSVPTAASFVAIGA